MLQRHDDLVVIGTASGGEASLDKAQSLRPQVVLMDLQMPGLSGLETRPRLRSAMPRVGVIALTLMDGKEYRKAALAAGADDFVSKDRVNIDLVSAIRRVVQQGTKHATGGPAI